MPFADLPLARIHYALSGPSSAPALILSHSLGTDLSLWDAQAPEFEKQFRLLRYDMRGHGQSSSPPPPYSVAELTSDLLSLADRLSLGRFHFCGLSVGGMIGMTLALQSPERLHRLVLCNTAPKLGTRESWGARINIVETQGMKEVSRITLDRWFTKSFQASSPDKVAATLHVVSSQNPQGYIGGCTAVRDFDARAQIAAIRVPTLVISGTHDPAATPADGRFMTEQIRGARYVELNTSHLSSIEASADFTREVLSFLTEFQESRHSVRA